MKVERNHSFHPNVSEQWQMGLFLSALFILDFESLMSESLSGSGCCAVLPQSRCVVNHCSKAGALSLWKPWCGEPTRLWWSLSQQFLLCCAILGTGRAPCVTHDQPLIWELLILIHLLFPQDSCQSLGVWRTKALQWPPAVFASTPGDAFCRPEPLFLTETSRWPSGKKVTIIDSARNQNCLIRLKPRTGNVFAYTQCN